MSVVEAGIDTARVLFRPLDEGARRRIDKRFAGQLVTSDCGGGLAAGWMPSYGVLWVEGRPAKALGLGTQLLDPRWLPDAVQVATRQLRSELGLGALREVGVSRLDATATVELGSPSEGWAVLRGMAALEMPRRKAALYAQRGHPETVYRLTVSGKVRERIYDKGAQLGTDEPGLRIRFEAQTRWAAGVRETTAAWRSPERVRDEFERRFEPMAVAARGLRVASPQVIAEQLRELVLADRLTGRQAELLLGHVTCDAVGIPRSRRTAYRRRADLKRLGLAQALDGIDDGVVDVPLADVLGDLLSASWDG